MVQTWYLDGLELDFIPKNKELLVPCKFGPNMVQIWTLHGIQFNMTVLKIAEL